MKKIFTFGGAYSIDRDSRVLGLTWFLEELPSSEEYEEAWNNLSANDNKVDYIMTYIGPYEVVTELGYECHDDSLEQLRFFQRIADYVDFKDWYFGHLHEDVDLENFHCRMDDVTQVE